MLAPTFAIALTLIFSHVGHVQQARQMFDLPRGTAELQWPLWLCPASIAGFPCRLPEVYHVDSTRNMQGRQALT